MNSVDSCYWLKLGFLVGRIFKNFLKRFKFLPETLEMKKIGKIGSEIDLAKYTASSSFLTTIGIKSSY